MHIQYIDSTPINDVIPYLRREKCGKGRNIPVSRRLVGFEFLSCLIIADKASATYMYICVHKVTDALAKACTVLQRSRFIVSS